MNQKSTKPQAVKIVDQVCFDFDGSNAIYSDSAIRALRALIPHWNEQITLGRSPQIISDDIDELRNQLEVMRSVIMSGIAWQQVQNASHRS
jgi:hypothetical protein